MNSFENIKFNDLTEEQLSQMTQTQMANKSLSEYVFEINNHMKAINFFIKNIIGSAILMLICTLLFGIYGLFLIIPLLFFVYWFFNFKNSMKWHIKSFKSTASMYNTAGFYSIVLIHQENINKNVLIGDFYKI